MEHELYKYSSNAIVPLENVEHDYLLICTQILSLFIRYFYFITSKVFSPRFFHFSIYLLSFSLFHYNRIRLLRGQFNSNIEIIIRYWQAGGLICDESVCKSRERENFFSSSLLHGLSLAILISTKDLVPSGRLKRITLHTNHRKEFS